MIMKHFFLGIIFFLLAITGQAQELVVRGTVTDALDGSPMPGVSVVLKGTTTGTITDIDGNYTLRAQMGNFLVFSFIGMETVDIKVVSVVTNVAMKSTTTGLDEVVIVGYGVQKKESVVGSIVQISNKELMQSGGVSTVGQALSGKLPGVTTISSTGRPGDESPEIFIRGQSSWNGDGQPLIIVDGVERTMSDIDIGDIASVSVLKDASATAVFGVKGANGVILINTKRGKEGHAQLRLSANSTMKVISKIPEKYDSYSGIGIYNEIIERTVSSDEEVWLDYTPAEIMEKYLNPANELESMLYPDVDWVDAVTKDFAMDHRLNLSVSGGSKYAKYFAALTYQHVGDIFSGADYSEDRGYEADFRDDRFNHNFTNCFLLNFLDISNLICDVI
jgi:TonB-linked SusC/RagA family outer membrane protein